jgi:hypothetical protein
MEARLLSLPSFSITLIQRALRKSLDGKTTRESRWDQLAEVRWFRTRIQQSVAHKGEEIVELVRRQCDGDSK